MLRRHECRLNFKNRPVRTGDLKGGGVINNPPPLPLIGVARSLPLIGMKAAYKQYVKIHMFPAKYTRTPALL